MTELNRLSASEAAAAIARGETTSEALVAACLERIAQREDAVRAWCHLDPEQALGQARAADRSEPRGPLHGVPVGIKDIIDTHDMPTRCGSPIYEHRQPPNDASCVALVRHGGGIVIGKTVTTEFAFSTPRGTRNPHNPAHTPGGSSSGSAAAVADFMVPLSFGTQTAGSVIRPAAFCGVVGYKGSFGSLPLTGVMPLGPNLDSLGVFARSIADVALMRAQLTGAPATLAPAPPEPRIGLCRTYEWRAAEPAMQQAVESTAQRAAEAGARVEEVNLPEHFNGLVEAQMTVLTYEGARALLSEYRLAPEKLSPGIRAMIEEGLALPHRQYAQAWDLARTCQAEFARLFADFEAWLAPSAPGEAPQGLESTGNPVFNRMWTFLHAACVNLPGQTGPKGLPLGVQAVAPLGSDDRLLAVCRWLEGALASS